MQLNLSADEVLKTTRSVRKRLDFDKPVERSIVEECLEIALQAPTGSNSQGWHWIFVEDAFNTIPMTVATIVVAGLLLVRLLRTAPLNRELVLNYIGEHVMGLPRSY